MFSHLCTPIDMYAHQSILCSRFKLDVNHTKRGKIMKILVKLLFISLASITLINESFASVFSDNDAVSQNDKYGYQSSSYRENSSVILNSDGSSSIVYPR